MDLYIFGAGQIAEVCAYYFRKEGRFQQHYFVVDAEYLASSTVDGLPVLATEEASAKAQPGKDQWFTAMGSAKRNSLRQQRAAVLRASGFTLASFIHPTATLWDGFVLPSNTMIMENNVFQYKSRLGRDSIVWSNNHVGHHANIGQNTFMASEVVISGSTEVGSNCFFGVNSTIFDNVTIGNRVIIGAGVVVRSDVADESVLR